MNVGFVSTRLAGTDGVSLETEKWAEIFRGSAHRTAFCAGELSHDEGFCVPEMHFAHPSIRRLHDAAFIRRDPRGLRGEIAKTARRLGERLDAFVRADSIDLLVAENCLTIPMNLPLGVALGDFVAATGIPTVAHHHDFWWERERFADSAVSEILARFFPPDRPSIRHVVINSLARDALARRHGLRSWVIPNVLDFDAKVDAGRSRSVELRRELDLRPADRLVLQPTRVIRRKGIEWAVDLVGRLAARDAGRGYTLLITHHAGDEGEAYLAELRNLAERAGVDLRYVPERFGDGLLGGASEDSRYALRDAYEAADLVTFPSRIEGFGNALLEAIYFRRPVLVNRYPVYVADIAPCGFRFIEMDHAVTEEAVDAAARLMADPERVRETTEHNFHVARDCFSYDVVRRALAEILPTFG